MKKKNKILIWSIITILVLFVAIPLIFHFKSSGTNSSDSGNIYGNNDPSIYSCTNVCQDYDYGRLSATENNDCTSEEFYKTNLSLECCCGNWGNQATQGY